MINRIKEIEEKKNFIDLISKFEAEVNERLEHLYDLERIDDQIRPWVYEHTMELYKELLNSLRHIKVNYGIKNDEQIILDLVDQRNNR